MKSLLAALLLAACQAPDRWNTSIARGNGDLSGSHRDYDMEETRFEVGVSGQLFPERKLAACPPQPVVLPTAPSAPDGGAIPWVELALLLCGAAAYKGSEVGVRKIRRKV